MNNKRNKKIYKLMKKSKKWESLILCLLIWTINKNPNLKKLKVKIQDLKINDFIIVINHYFFKN